MTQSNTASEKTKQIEEALKVRKNRKFVYLAIACLFVLGLGYVVWKFASVLPKATKSKTGEIQLTKGSHDENAAFWTTDGRIRFASHTKEKPLQRGVINPMVRILLLKNILFSRMGSG